jgi:hypothetical protein
MMALLETSQHVAIYCKQKEFAYQQTIVVSTEEKFYFIS